MFSSLVDQSAAFMMYSHLLPGALPVTTDSEMRHETERLILPPSSTEKIDG